MRNRCFPNTSFFIERQSFFRRVIATRLSILTFVFSLSNLCWAESAADKAMARELAEAGIDSLASGNAQRAEQQLKKAQALYDAPVHLLYLARAQAQQGKLIEAVENYRSLERTKLASGAPAVFKNAQKAGAVELEKLEPRLARLTIKVTPEDIDGLEVWVDDEPLNLAALSAPRAINPGTHQVRASAAGYDNAEFKIDLSEGARESVELTLRAHELAAGVVEEQAESAKEESSNEAPTTDEQTGPMGFIVGARVGAGLPLGHLESPSDQNPSGTPIGDYFQTGVTVRGELGFRFARYFAVKGVFGVGFPLLGDQLSAMTDARVDGTETDIDLSRRLTDVGFSVMATTDPRKLGAFIELGYFILHEYRWAQKVSAPGLATCKDNVWYPGGAFRVGGGMNLPVSSFLTLVPNVEFNVGSSRGVHTNYTCSPPTNPGAALPVETAFDKSLNYQLFFGFGGDLHFGDSWFR